MAANKFATMLHRNTHKLVVVLTYAILEWILILLLLVNSIFTYLIVKFANYFGLKPPCLWCSRVDHVLEPGKTTASYRELVCEVHATEISKLGYCSSHRRLADSEHMCIDCLVTLPNQNNEANAITGSISFISLMTKEKLEDVEKVCSCSCCNGSLSSKYYPPYLLFKSSWGALNCNRKGNLISEAVDGESNEGHEHKECSRLDSPENCVDDDYEIKGNDGGENNPNDKCPADEYHQLLADVECFGIREEAEEDFLRPLSNLPGDEVKEAQALDIAQKEFSGMNYQSTDDTHFRICCLEDDSLKITDLGYERVGSCDLDRLITIELIDAATKREYLSGSDDKNEIFDLVLEVETEGNISGEASLLGADVREEEPESFQREPYSNIECEEVLGIDTDHAVPGGSSEEKAAAVEKTDCYTEEKSRQTVLNTQQEESLKIDTGAEISASPEAPLAGNELGANHTGKGATQEKTSSSDNYQAGINDHLSIRSEPTNDAEEEKLPDTPTSLDSLHYLHKKLLLLEKRDSGAEESLDGSVLSEMEGGDPVLTIERLRASLNAEQRVLRTLYAELEEERNSAAISTNQTMAMITRLQEEKAAMQMEALQYQRMMEEQSEYDQEALQLMNELMIKREKEKQELEKELEICRIKVSEYETKEELRLMRSSKDGSITGRNDSSVSCSYTDDGDELSIDLNRDARDEDSSICCNHECSINSTPADTVLSLEEVALDCVKHMTALDNSLAEFEEEKLFILDQLKALEEKLIRIDNGEEPNSIEHSLEYKVDEPDEYRDCSSPEETEVSMDKSHPERKTMASMAKTLLPLLEATTDSESEEKFIHSENAVSESVEVELDSNKLAIIEEVDHVYERLQALETDREFLKHCMNSIEKGDKGTNLLQEILQHLRDLRAVELRMQSIDNAN